MTYDNYDNIRGRRPSATRVGEPKALAACQFRNQTRAFPRSNRAVADGANKAFWYGDRRMLLTITTTHRPAGDLGYLLHKHPDRFQSFDLSFGKVHVYYPEV